MLIASLVYWLYQFMQMAASDLKVNCISHNGIQWLDIRQSDIWRSDIRQSAM